MTVLLVYMAKTRSNQKESIRTDNFSHTKVATKIATPKLYRVLLINDDYTPMDFVVHILQRFFHKDNESAKCIMLKVHHKGSAECGFYTYEIAEMKVNQVMNYARNHQHPLQCVMEKE